MTEDNRRQPALVATGRIVFAAAVVVVPLIGAQWWLPPEFPRLPRQLLLAAWGVGACWVAAHLVLRESWRRAARSLGFVPTPWRAVLVSSVVSVPMWAFLPLFARMQGVSVGLRSDAIAILAGVVLVNGLAEEVIHRGFVFGSLRRDRSFGSAAALSAALFAAQHLYLVATLGWTAGAASVALAALLGFPLAFVFERGGRSLVGPAILHTSSNAPALVFTLPETFVVGALVPHMAVVLASLYLVFPLRRLLLERPEERP
jgi:membrane protease YdiL (CAAX protease family)